MTTAPAVLTAAPANVADMLKYQNDCLRQNKYIFLGWIQRIVLERTTAMFVPPSMEEDLKSDPSGLSIEFFDQPNWLPVGQVEAAGQQSFLLPLAPIGKNSSGYVQFPDKPDDKWVPDGPPRSEKQPDGSYKMIRAKAPMLQQSMRTFSEGVLRGTNFAVYGRVAQILLKAQGVAEGWILKTAANLADSPPTHMTFLVDLKTGEAHFYGGLYDISKPGQM